MDRLNGNLLAELLMESITHIGPTQAGRSKNTPRENLRAQIRPLSDDKPGLILAELKGNDMTSAQNKDDWENLQLCRIAKEYPDFFAEIATKVNGHIQSKNSVFGILRPELAHVLRLVGIKKSLSMRELVLAAFLVKDLLERALVGEEVFDIRRKYFANSSSNSNPAPGRLAHLSKDDVLRVASSALSKSQELLDPNLKNSDKKIIEAVDRCMTDLGFSLGAQSSITAIQTVRSARDLWIEVISRDEFS
ncbi:MULTISPECIES: hypothetical protein [Roseomonadaceae]|uniref:Uncharacterized protein n=1 Tax=Falsiroseomonas oleicola TaxID=2801474 RepID=A0ABS6HDD9_9PROT|nr:hypothetical protein [Roseomonas oleicola]MBU8545832.1 hypothetical protein [Roseomonas oleicola]